MKRLLNLTILHKTKIASLALAGVLLSSCNGSVLEPSNNTPPPPPAPPPPSPSPLPNDPFAGPNSLPPHPVMPPMLPPAPTMPPSTMMPPPPMNPNMPHALPSFPPYPPDQGANRFGYQPGFETEPGIQNQPGLETQPPVSNDALPPAPQDTDIGMEIPLEDQIDKSALSSDPANPIENLFSQEAINQKLVHVQINFKKFYNPKNLVTQEHVGVIELHLINTQTGARKMFIGEKGKVTYTGQHKNGSLSYTELVQFIPEQNQLKGSALQSSGEKIYIDGIKAPDNSEWYFRILSEDGVQLFTFNSRTL